MSTKTPVTPFWLSTWKLAVYGCPVGANQTVCVDLAHPVKGFLIFSGLVYGNQLAVLLGQDAAAFDYHPVNRLDKGTSGLLCVAPVSYTHLTLPTNSLV